VRVFSHLFSFLSAALDARGTPLTKEGLMILAVMSKVVDLEKGNERTKAVQS